MPPKLYLIVLVGGVEPEQYGPFDNDALRLAAAELMWDANDSYVRLDITENCPSVSSFSGEELGD